MGLDWPPPIAAIASGTEPFLPYAWLQRTRAYVVPGVAVSVGALGVQVVLGSAAFPYVLAYMPACYWVAAPIVARNARRLAAA